jgi:large subunit ribosomal protein L19
MEYIESKQLRTDITDFRTGDTVRVHWKVKEGEKERVQPFEGIVIRKTKGHNRATFTVRKVSYGVGVERIFPLHSPRYEKIEVLSHGDVRRNRLFFLRNLRGKASRVDAQEEQGEGPGQVGRPAASQDASASEASEPSGDAGAGSGEGSDAANESKASAKKAGAGKSPDSKAPPKKPKVSAGAAD